jgi:hypothetical protein
MLLKKNNDYNKITDILKSFNIFNINELYTFLNNISKKYNSTNIFITEPVNEKTEHVIKQKITNFDSNQNNIEQSDIQENFNITKKE